MWSHNYSGSKGAPVRIAFVNGTPASYLARQARMHPAGWPRQVVVELRGLKSPRVRKDAYSNNAYFNAYSNNAYFNAYSNSAYCFSRLATAWALPATWKIARITQPSRIVENMPGVSVMSVRGTVIQKDRSGVLVSHLADCYWIDTLTSTCKSEHTRPMQ
jgi:hypothetical protein